MFNRKKNPGCAHQNVQTIVSHQDIIHISSRTVRTRQRITHIVLEEEDLRFHQNVALLVEVHTRYYNYFYHSPPTRSNPYTLLHLYYNYFYHSPPTRSNPYTLQHLYYNYFYHSPPTRSNPYTLQHLYYNYFYHSPPTRSNPYTLLHLYYNYFYHSPPTRSNPYTLQHPGEW